MREWALPQSAASHSGGIENKKLITLSIVNSKLFYIFLSKDLLCIVCTFNTLIQAEVAYTLTMKEAISFYVLPSA